MITIVSPHPDDAELGASMYLQPGSQILLITTTDEREREQSAASEYAGVGLTGLWAKEGSLVADSDLVTLIEACLSGSDIVLSPPTADTHQDHRAVAHAVRSSVRRSDIALLEYETPSTTPDWEPNVFVPMERSDLSRQSEMLHRFTSQTDRPYFDRSWLAGRARVHGMRVGVTYAQAFRLVVSTGVALYRSERTPL
jgi:LmbE family N-acetylglucosaminyl deacetylase